MRYLTIITLAIATFMFSCEGPVGPQGPEGPQGNRGPQGEPGTEGFTFEYISNFAAPDYESLLELPSNFQLLESDVALVYIYQGTTTEFGETVEVWEPLPQLHILEEGILQYYFNHTLYSVLVSMQANFDISILGTQYTNDQIFRVVVVPAQFFDSGRMAVDLNDYHAVTEHFGIKEVVKMY